MRDARYPLQRTTTFGVSTMVSTAHDACLSSWAVSNDSSLSATTPHARLSAVMVPASYVANTITSLAGITSVSKRASGDLTTKSPPPPIPPPFRPPTRLCPQPRSSTAPSSHSVLRQPAASTANPCRLPRVRRQGGRVHIDCALTVDNPRSCPSYCAGWYRTDIVSVVRGHNYSMRVMARVSCFCLLHSSADILLQLCRGGKTFCAVGRLCVVVNATAICRCFTAATCRCEWHGSDVPDLRQLCDQRQPGVWLHD